MARETRQFKMHPHLLYDVIKRQAGTLHKAILEGVMNAVDAGATEIKLSVEGPIITIEDNGRGMTDRRVIETYWETFGQPPEAHEKKTYGQFRMGRGQLFAFGANHWRTGTFEMSVDIATKGLDYTLAEHPENAVTGCQVMVVLYSELMPSDLAQLQRELTESVKYVPAKITYNGELLSVDPESVKWDHVTPDAYIRFRKSGHLAVYNLGVLVCHHAGHTFGVGGEVVSRKQLKVNFARNDVMSDCAVWRRIKTKVDAEAGRELHKTKTLDDAGRQRLIDQFVVGQLADFKIYKLLQDANGRYWSLRQLISLRQWNDTLTVAPNGNRLADKLMQQKMAFVLSAETLERFRCRDLAHLVNTLRGQYSHWANGAKLVEFARLREELDEHYAIVPEAEWSNDEYAVMRTLKGGSYRLTNYMYRDSKRYVTARQLRLGVSHADGWTDGKSYIAINRDYIKKCGHGLGSWAAYGLLLIHEMCHDSSDQESHTHTDTFYQQHHDLAAGALQGFVDYCITQFPATVAAQQRRLTKKQLRNQDRAVKATKASQTLAASVSV